MALTGGAVSSVARLTADENLENAYVFFIEPAGDGPVIFPLVAERACADGGICTQSGALLSAVPAARLLTGPTGVGPQTQSPP